MDGGWTLPAATVYLVGAGPGDPDLLTVRAARLLAGAEVVVHDRLVSERVLDLAPAARRIDVGKRAGRHPVPQARINALLVALARQGRPVVRLKGGDPFVFGRGGEEAVHLATAGVPCEVVPGITAAQAGAAAVAIPLTHRGLATGLRYVTGHCREGEPLDLDWEGLADPATTLVIYMGLANLPIIAAHLMAAGRPGSTPAAAIASASLPAQRVVLGTLADLAPRALGAGLEAPVLVVVGEVVRLGQFLGAARPVSVSAPLLAHHA